MASLHSFIHKYVHYIHSHKHTDWPSQSSAKRAAFSDEHRIEISCAATVCRIRFVFPPSCCHRHFSRACLSPSRSAFVRFRDHAAASARRHRRHRHVRHLLALRRRTRSHRQLRKRIRRLSQRHGDGRGGWSLAGWLIDWLTD